MKAGEPPCTAARGSCGSSSSQRFAEPELATIQTVEFLGIPRISHDFPRIFLGFDYDSIRKLGLGGPRRS